MMHASLEIQHLRSVFYFAEEFRNYKKMHDILCCDLRVLTELRSWRGAKNNAAT